MAKATWRIVALAALLGAVAPMASVQAQVVIGGEGQPDVVVNWSVLDSLGRQPSLADMLKNDLHGGNGPAPLTQPGVQQRAQPSTGSGLAFKPYKPGKGKTPAAKPAKAQAQAKKVAPTKVAASQPAAPSKPAVAAKPQPPREEPADIAAMVQERKAAQVAKPEAPAKVAASAAKPAAPAKPPVAETVPAPKGPEIALPETKPSAVSKPVEMAKVPEAIKAAPAKVAEAVKTPEPVKVPEPTKITEAVKAEAAKTVDAAKSSAAAAIEPPKPLAVPAPAAIAAAPQPLLAPVPPPIPVMPQQVASLPSAEAPAVSRGADTLSLLFAADESKLSDSGRSELAALVKRMQKDEDLNLQLLAYASGDEASSSKARRLSLSRALEVRKVLMDKGIRSTRIEVRALGNKLDGRGPADRVDAVLVGR